MGAYAQQAAYAQQMAYAQHAAYAAQYSASHAYAGYMATGVAPEMSVPSAPATAALPNGNEAVTATNGHVESQTASEALPEGWSSAVDPSSGKTYYISIAGQTS